uniref:procollagen-lysine 5-dioxygenase n=1 Tax=Diabrotica virgifera virgifera TaxID=50390 RepID=A0A6P7FY86_DIAVI
MFRLSVCFCLCIFNVKSTELECDVTQKTTCDAENNTSLFANLKTDILVYTVATDQTNGFDRYLHSANEFNIQPQILGLGHEWKGGQVKTHPGGGFKFNLLKKALEEHKASKKLVLFTDSYDVIFLGKMDEIIRRFKQTGAKILFGAEPFCWPDPKLADQYPEATEGKRFLNSGMFIGYAPEIYKLLTRDEIQDTDDDQLYCTKAYLDEQFRDEAQIKLDHKSEIFQNLNGVSAEIEIATRQEKEGEGELYYVRNTLTRTEPLVIHGNGAAKYALNYLSNYVPNVWNSVDGCKQCKKGAISLGTTAPKDFPSVLISVFIEQSTPFLEEMLQKVYFLDYPKERLHIFIHNSVKYHVDIVKDFVDKYSSDYASFKQITPEDGTPEWTARDLSLDHCLSKKCDFYFSLDAIAHIDNPYTLKLLIEQNRTVVAPMLTRPGKAWSNFWGALTKDGFYSRSNDYMDIVHNEKRGLWNVPFISNAYIINATLLRKHDRKVLNYTKPNLDADMTFCSNLRDLDVFMYVSNRLEFGHLINADTFDTTRTEPDMYQIFENERDWEDRYINEEYPENFNLEKKDAQPCPDVYWFPIVSKRFNEALIHMMESYGKWSSGKNEDDRLNGGYEAVPTRDIHMNQVGWERHWLHFLQKYVRPLQEKVFTGYYHDPPKSLMNFVVRYRPDEQPLLRPHHDSSTYTINIALNEKGVDYEGGGCRFIRYNCSVVDTKPGWLLMHPGRLTHFHEGLLVTKGTRYIMIAFVDP